MSAAPLESNDAGPVAPARRAFLGTALLATGAALSGALAAWVRGVGETRRVTDGATGARADALTATDDDAWHVDDVWGHRPRYAHPIPHAGVAYDTVSWDHVDPIDRPFMI